MSCHLDSRPCRAGAKGLDPCSCRWAQATADYDDLMALTSPGLARPARWSLWLGVGVLCGLSLGFAFGLAKPRMRK